MPERTHQQQAKLAVYLRRGMYAAIVIFFTWPWWSAVIALPENIRFFLSSALAVSTFLGSYIIGRCRF